jgi:hypothetical protein
MTINDKHDMTSLPKHFMMTEMSAPERQSFSSVTFAFLGTGTMVAILKHVGTADWDRERLNMSVNTPASWSAHALMTRLEIPSRPAALRGLTGASSTLMATATVGQQLSWPKASQPSSSSSFCPGHLFVFSK